MTTTGDPSVLAASIIDHIASAVATGGDSAQARKALNEIIKAQKDAANEAEAAEEAAAAEREATAFKTAEKFILRPNGTEYWVRKLGEHSDVAALRGAREKGFPIMAYGPPGTGKTALIEAAYAVDGQQVHTVQGTGDTETADFIGGYVQLAGGEFAWHDGPMLKAMQNGEVLYIDEIALIDPKVMAVVYSVMDGRGEYTVTQNPERGTVQAAEGFYIVSACNPNAPGARLSEAILSRFIFQFEVTTDYNLCKRLGVAPKMVTAAQNMQRKVESGELGWSPQTREMLAFRDMAAVFGEDFALRNMIAAAPEIDRGEVMSILARTWGVAGITALSID